ncbi:MAG: restriction endonuclease subunit S [Chitinophagaceae bacterium]|nr:restriction endonuclease subunit S [Chitinophagaceae bacterium]
MAKTNTNPEMRFAGFTEEWEEKGFERVFSNISNNSLSREKLNYITGLAKNVHYGDILVKFNDVLDVKKVSLPYISDNATVEKLKKSILKDGDIIISDAAEDEIVGKCVELYNVNEEIILAGLHTIAVRPEEKFARKFLGYYMNSNSYHDQLLKLIQGTKVLSISKTAIKNTFIRHPQSIYEQKLIGNFFENLDQLITEQQQKHSKLKSLKKAMLNKMFPKQGQLVPEIRFKGFEGEWVEKEFRRIFNYERPDNYIVLSNEYSNKFKTPVLTANKAFILGYTFETRTFNETCIIFDDFTLDSKFVDFPFMVKSSALKILTIQNINTDYIRFAFFNLVNKKIEIMGHARHYISVVQKTKVLVPTITEQILIGNYFKNLDELIQNHEVQIAKLQNIKKAFLAKMFI